MARATITNATFDTAAAAAPAPYGPLTRVGDLDATPTISPNSDVEVECTSAASVTLFISYEQLNGDTVQRDMIIKEAHGVNAHIQDFEDLVTALNTLFSVTEWDSLTTGAEDWTKIIRCIQALEELAAIIPTHAFEEVDDSNTLLVASFSVAQSGTGNRDVVFTNLSTGLYHHILWILDDGNIVTKDPVPDDFTYVGAGADTFNPVLLLIGPQGVVTDTQAVAVT